MKKKPRFFCNHCGYEVGSEVVSCPYCGRYFSSIRCPACSYSGPDRMFKNGCPMCGYSAPPTKPKKGSIIKSPRNDEHRHQPLPFWTFIAAFIALFGVIALLSYLITR